MGALWQRRERQCVLGDHLGAIVLLAVVEGDMAGCVVGARDDIGARAVPIGHCYDFFSEEF